MRLKLSTAAPGLALACVAAACADAWPSGASALAADRAAPRSAAVPVRTKVVVDHAVVPAGGHHCGHAACRVHHGHLAGCRDGHCAPHCPVRPSQYGFYGTQWRQWPGQGVVPVSAEDAATPISPPPSQVPQADEESPRNPDAPPAAEPMPEEPVPPIPPTPPGQPPSAPEPGGGAERLFDQSAVPMPVAEEEPSIDVAGMRYPALSRRVVATGGVPRTPPPVQRAGDSERGL